MAVVVSRRLTATTIHRAAVVFTASAHTVRTDQLCSRCCPPVSGRQRLLHVCTISQPAAPLQRRRLLSASNLARNHSSLEHVLSSVNLPQYYRLFPITISPLLLPDEPSWAEVGLPNLAPSLTQLGLPQPTLIQSAAIPYLNVTYERDDSPDVIITDEPGTGKTLAYLLPLLARLDLDLNAVQAVICVPSRAMGVQLSRTIESLTRAAGLHRPDALNRLRVQLCESGVAEEKAAVKAAVGRTAPSPSTDAGSSTPHVLIGTPRVLHKLLVKQQQLDCSAMAHLVVDEADWIIKATADQVLLDLLALRERSSPSMQLRPSSSRSRGRVVFVTSVVTRAVRDFAVRQLPHWNLVLLSPASVPSLVRAQGRQLLCTYMHLPDEISGPHRLVRSQLLHLSSTISHHYVLCLKSASRAQKLTQLSVLLVAIRSTMRRQSSPSLPQTTLVVFDNVNDKSLPKTHSLLATSGWRVAALTADAGRLAVSEALSQQHPPEVILATESTMRGLSIDTISHVVNFSSELFQNAADVYYRRAGRCGRLGQVWQQGRVISMCWSEMDVRRVQLALAEMRLGVPNQVVVREESVFEQSGGDQSEASQRELTVADSSPNTAWVASDHLPPNSQPLQPPSTQNQPLEPQPVHPPSSFPVSSSTSLNIDSPTVADRSESSTAWAASNSPTSINKPLQPSSSQPQSSQSQPTPSSALPPSPPSELPSVRTLTLQQPSPLSSLDALSTVTSKDPAACASSSASPFPSSTSLCSSTGTSVTATASTASASSPTSFQHYLGFGTLAPPQLHDYFTTQLQYHILPADAHLLLSEDVDGQSALSLTHDVLKQLGVATYGRRQRILDAIAGGTVGFSVVPSNTDNSTPSTTNHQQQELEKSQIDAGSVISSVPSSIQAEREAADDIGQRVEQQQLPSTPAQGEAVEAEGDEQPDAFLESSLHSDAEPGMSIDEDTTEQRDNENKRARKEQPQNRVLSPTKLPLYYQHLPVATALPLPEKPSWADVGVSSLSRRLLWLGLSKPTIIQCAAIPHLTSRRSLVDPADVIITDEPGTGKTLAYLLPLLARLDLSLNAVQAVVCVPSRAAGEELRLLVNALKFGICLNQRKPTSSMRVRLSAAPLDAPCTEVEIKALMQPVPAGEERGVVGKMDADAEGEAVALAEAEAQAETDEMDAAVSGTTHVPHILISTPQILHEMLVKRELLECRQVRYVVVDEADVLIEAVNEQVLSELLNKCCSSGGSVASDLELEASNAIGKSATGAASLSLPSPSLLGRVVFVSSIITNRLQLFAMYYSLVRGVVLLSPASVPSLVRARGRQLLSYYAKLPSHVNPLQPIVRTHTLQLSSTVSHHYVRFEQRRGGARYRHRRMLYVAELLDAIYTTTRHSPSAHGSGNLPPQTTLVVFNDDDEQSLAEALALWSSRWRVAALTPTSSWKDVRAVTRVTEPPAVIVATDAAIRGVSFDTVSHVVNFSSPPPLDTKEYLRRSYIRSYYRRAGRCGRLGQAWQHGRVINMCWKKQDVKRVEEVVAEMRGTALTQMRFSSVGLTEEPAVGGDKKRAVVTAIDSAPNSAWEVGKITRNQSRDKQGSIQLPAATVGRPSWKRIFCPV